jgi:hypothetical protein
MKRMESSAVSPASWPREEYRNSTHTVIQVPNEQINIWLISSLLYVEYSYSPAVQGVGGSCPDRDMFVSGARVEDGDDLGQVSPYYFNFFVLLVIFLFFSS